MEKTKKAVKAITVQRAAGKVAFKKVSGSKQLAVSKKTGKVTVKKGAKRKTYKAKVRVTAAGNESFASLVKYVTVKVVVK